MKQCPKCGLDKDLVDFNNDRTRTDGLSSWCRKCKKEARTPEEEQGARRRYYERRVRAIEILGGACVVCGTVDNLQFDHIDPTTKTFSMSKVLTRSDWREELQKCQLLCENHHKQKTKGESIISMAEWTAEHRARLAASEEVKAKRRETWRRKRERQEAG